MAGTVLVGTAVAEVAVPPGTPMAGYAARTGPSEGTADPVTVRGLVLAEVALLTVDVCALHERTIARIREAAPAQLLEVIVTATHTHSGPCVAFGRLGPHAAEVHEHIVAAAAQVLGQATAGRRPCQLHQGHTPGQGYARNRRHPTDPADPPVQFLRFDHAGRPVAWLVVYPSHPVVLDGANRSISGDYPAALRARIEQAAPGSLCVFATGAAGDLNPDEHTPADSFAATDSPSRTLTAATRMGRALAEAVLQAPTSAVALGEVTAVRVPVELSVDRVSPAQAAADRDTWAAELAAGSSTERRALLTAWIGWAERLLAGTLDHGESTWPASVTAVGLGAVHLVALPGEPFLATAVRIAAGAPDRTLVLGYADGCAGYLPPRAEYAHGGYEVLEAHRYYAMPGPFAAGSAEQLETAAAAALAALDR